MFHLLLTEGFNPYNAREEQIVQHERSFFPGGEPHIRITTQLPFESDVHISLRINSFNDLGMLLIAAEALRTIGSLRDLFISIPYFPGARQDRIANPGEALSARVYANLINDLGAAEVRILDCHSDVAPALIDTVTNINNHAFVEEVLKREGMMEEPCEINLVAPDAGATKKVFTLCKFLKSRYPEHEFNLIQAGKYRDTVTGAITAFRVYDEVFKEEPYFIVDDICDGGGTFLGLAKEMEKQGATHLNLIITHGIFSKGFRELNDTFKKVYCTDSFFDINNAVWRMSQPCPYPCLRQIRINELTNDN